MMYRKILVPLDGSEFAAQGLDHAIELARTCGAPLSLLHVIDIYPMGMEWADASTWNNLVEGWRAQGQSMLAEARAKAQAKGVAAETQLIEFPPGRVADSIVAQAQAQGCDLIVMGSHGRRGMGRMLLGSDAELVLRTSHVPVLVVRRPPVETGS